MTHRHRRKEKRRPLTEVEWQKVFELRCKAKRGERIDEIADRALLEAAYAEDPERYAGMSAEVFNATAPFGSVRRA